jgi:hypothetical protein
MTTARVVLNAWGRPLQPDHSARSHLAVDPGHPMRVRPFPSYQLFSTYGGQAV